MENNIKDFIQSKKFKILLVVIGGVILILLSFQAGMFVGYRKTAFSYGFGDNYYRAFEGGRGGRGGMMGGFMMMGDPNSFPGSHGSVGQVVSVSLPTFVVQDRDGVEKVIRLSSDTSIVEFREKISEQNIKVGDFVVVVGSPNTSSEIEAKLIRIMPAPQDMMVGTTTLK